MINETLAKLIVDNTEEMALFVQLLSLSIVENLKTVKLDDKDLNSEQKQALNMYKISGLLKYSILNGVYTITFKEDNHWLLEGPKIIKTKKEEKEFEITGPLRELADLLGIPADWHTNSYKYVANYKRIVRIYTKKVVDEVSEYAIEKNPKIDLNLFLTHRVFRDLRSSMISAHNKGKKDRVDTADYSEEQPY